MIVLDLFAEVKPIWKNSSQFYGTPYVWCMLHNFGGNIEMYGTLDSISSGPVDARISENSTMVGVGMCMEGIEHNPVVYELMSEMAFRSEKVQVLEWLKSYSHRRYGKAIHQVAAAWEILYHTIYNCTDGIELDKLQYSAVAVTRIVDHNTDFIVKFPDWDPSNTSSALPQAHLWYSTKKVINALRLFIDAGNNFAGSLTYRQNFGNEPLFHTFQLLYHLLLLLWGGTDGGLKHCLVKWDTICSPIADGGLGVRKLVPFNRALLGKWLWRFGEEGDRLWKRVLIARYGAVCGGWSTGLVRGSHGCGLWKGIMQGWESFNAHLRYKVGIGDRVRLWHDQWCGDVTLKEAYPVLYECASNQAATIDEVVVRDNGRMEWNVIFKRNFNDWELNDVVSFLNLIQSHLPFRELADGIRWNLMKSGMFDVRSFYSALREDILFRVGAACVVVMVRQQTICFFTALWRLLYGVGYFTLLGFSGLCLDRSFPYCPAGGMG
uniref:Alpha-N-acetylglucosaminidase tim-barrel domain-containing protein n=2 Tax=Fagus sylvatica TaxID=28930 RepID=A0A2N9FB34_FAGSY